MSTVTCLMLVVCMLTNRWIFYIVVVTVGEAQNPRKVVPKAIKRVFWRILIFYVLAILMIGLLVPYTDSRLLSASSTVSTSPFVRSLSSFLFFKSSTTFLHRKQVIAISNAGIKGLPSVINAVLLISAWSAGNSDVYASSRTLYALALEGKAPKCFRKCTKDGMPIWSVLVTSLFGFLSFMGVGSGKASLAFTWVSFFQFAVLFCFVLNDELIVFHSDSCSTCRR